VIAILHRTAAENITIALHVKDKYIQTNTQMKSFLFFMTVFTLFALASCGPAKQDSQQTQQVPVVPPAQQPATPASAEPAQAAVDEAALPASTEQDTAEVMLNPPHGQPFHRCDIPVGAPLNSTATSNIPQTTNNQIQLAAPQASASAPSVENNPTAPTIENAMRISPSQTQNTTSANTGTKPRLNPAHGQPYHRCDIPVGSVLP
jgi:hypothetical protein